MPSFSRCNYRCPQVSETPIVDAVDQNHFEEKSIPEATKSAMKYDLAEACLSLRFDAFDDKTVTQAKRVFLYHVWTGFKGLHADKMGPEAAFKVAQAMGLGDGKCTVIAQEFRANPLDAAYLNCHLIGGGGYDDVIFPSGMHAGLLIIPVTAALAEERQKSGADFLAALITGYEILGKFGKWTWSNRSPRRPGTVFGPIACAGAAARLLDLSVDETAEALGYAAHAAMGLPCNLNTQLHSMACRAGVMAAYYAQAGGTCPPDIFEGELGFFKTFFGETPGGSKVLLKDFGGSYSIMASREKRYAGTMLNLVAVEKMRELVLAHGLSAENTRGVRVELSAARQKHPTAQLRPPYQTSLEAFASCQFLIALLLLDGDIREEERSQSTSDPVILKIIERVDVSFVEHPNPIYARIVVECVDGREFTAEGEDFIFEPIDPRQHIYDEARGKISEERIRQFVKSAEALEKAPQFSDTMKLLSSR